ncbi:5-formyltetrahydrofolate cyclo-ligase [beta proteobacterium MWH-UniP1]
MAQILSIEKSPLRQRLLGQREQLSAQKRLAAEKKISDVLSAKAVTQGWLKVAVFLPWRGEPDLMSTWRAWHARGLLLALPVVVARDAPLLMQAWQPGAALIRDAMGLSVPAQAHTLDCDTWLIPCVGVDPQGARLGAGKGFYDRTIAITPSPWPRLVGVCFDHARHDQSFGEAHDIRLDACVTETGWHDFRR